MFLNLSFEEKKYFMTELMPEHLFSSRSQKTPSKFTPRKVKSILMHTHQSWVFN